jgi:hypothetical protein
LEPGGGTQLGAPKTEEGGITSPSETPFPGSRGIPLAGVRPVDARG